MTETNQDYRIQNIDSFDITDDELESDYADDLDISMPSGNNQNISNV